MSIDSRRLSVYSAETLEVDEQLCEEVGLEPLSGDVFAALERRILKDGYIRDKIVHWQGMVLDGVHRLKVWSLHKDVLPEPDLIDLYEEGATRAQAVEWAKENQAARRNDELQQCEILKLKYERMTEMAKDVQDEVEKPKADSAKPKKDAAKGKNKKKTNKKDSKPQGRAVERVAAKHGVSSATVSRNAAWEKAMEFIESVSRSTAQQIRSGKLPRATQRDVVMVVKEHPDKVSEVCANWKAGRKWNEGPDGEEIHVWSGSHENRLKSSIQSLGDQLRKKTAWDGLDGDEDWEYVTGLWDEFRDNFKQYCDEHSGS